MKTVILYRTVLLAVELSKKYQSSTSEWKYLNKLVLDFNNGEQNSLSEDMETYSVITESE